MVGGFRVGVFEIPLAVDNCHLYQAVLGVGELIGAVAVLHIAFAQLVKALRHSIHLGVTTVVFHFHTVVVPNVTCHSHNHSGCNADGDFCPHRNLWREDCIVERTLKVGT